MPGLPTDSGHLSDMDVDLLIEKFGGKVEVQFVKHANMREFVPVEMVKNTDTITNNRMGRTTLQALVPGVRPDATKTSFGRVQLTIDTVILSRANRSLLNEFQDHISNAMSLLAEDQGKELAKFFDQAFLIQCIKGSHLGVPVGVNSESFNGAFGAGKNVTLDSAGDENDPDKMYDAIDSIVTSMKEEDIDTSDLVVFVRPTMFSTLLKNDKLTSRDFSEGNADVAARTIYQIAGVRIVETARIPNAAITGHKLSNADNGNAYDLSADEAKAVAVIMHPRSLLAGETIPLTSKIFWSDEEKQWFIDSWLAFGVTPNRPDVCGTVNKV